MIIRKEAFKELSEVHHTHCISIYMPKTNTEKDRIRLKNLIRDAEKELIENYHLQERDVKQITRSIRETSTQEGFWRREGNGLAIFIYEDKLFFKFYPVKFEPQMRVGEHLYLLPLAPLVHLNDGVLLLVLSAGNVQLFSADRMKIKEHEISSKLPRGLKDVVGYDYRQKSLQYRSGQGEANGGMYHGHGAGDQEEQKNEYLKYFHEIDDILTRNISDQSKMLVVACVDYLFPLFKEACSYENLYPEPVTGNFDEIPKNLLHKKTNEILDRLEKDELNEKKKDFQERLNKKAASFNPEDIIPAAINGRVESLFIKKNAELWGKYIESGNEIEIDKSDHVNNASLLNLSAIHTINNSGTVYIAEEIPSPESIINANFRYSL